MGMGWRRTGDGGSKWKGLRLISILWCFRDGDFGMWLVISMSLGLLPYDISYQATIYTHKSRALFTSITTKRLKWAYKKGYMVWHKCVQGNHMPKLLRRSWLKRLKRNIYSHCLYSWALLIIRNDKDMIFDEKTEGLSTNKKQYQINTTFWIL